MRSSSSSVTAALSSWPDEEDGVLVADGEGGAVERAVPAQEVLVERGVVLLGRRHHVGLVVQGALAQVEPDGEDVLLLAPHPHEPAPLAGLVVALDRGDHGVLASWPSSHSSMRRLEVVELLGAGRGTAAAGTRRRVSVQSTAAARGEVAVDAAAGAPAAVDQV